MRAFTIQRLACTLAILYLVFDPKINVVGEDLKDLEKNLPPEYKEATGSGATVLQNIWGSFSIRYVRSPNNVTTIIYYGPYTKGWLGIGFSKTGRMIGSSAMVGWVSDDLKNMIKQYSLEGYRPTLVIPDKGELQLTKVAPANTIIREVRYLAFQLKLPDMHQKVIFTSSRKSPIRDTLAMHTEATMKEIDFSKGVVDDSKSQLKATHGWVAFSAWIFMIRLGIDIAHNFRHHDPLWFYLHMSCNLLGYILAFSTILLGLKVSSVSNVKWGIHKWIGIIAFLLATLQVVAICARPAKNSPNRRYWNMYHRGVGFTAQVLGLLNFCIGLRYGGKTFHLFIATLVWLAIALAGNVYFAYRNEKRKELENQQQQPPVFNPTP